MHGALVKPYDHSKPTLAGRNINQASRYDISMIEQIGSSGCNVAILAKVPGID